MDSQRDGLSRQAKPSLIILLRDLAVIYIIDLEDCFSVENWNLMAEVYQV